MAKQFDRIEPAHAVLVGFEAGAVPPVPPATVIARSDSDAAISNTHVPSDRPHAAQPAV
jgi:hypothetical protein